MLAWSASRRTSSYHLQRDRPLQPILAARASCILRREVQWAEVRTLGRPAGALNHGQDPVPGHTGHGTHKRTRGHTEDTDEPHNHPNPTTHPHDHATAETRNRGRLNNSKNSRRPGTDHSPRPTQRRPPPANPTLPPPAPRAPPRACSKAVGEMKARAAPRQMRTCNEREAPCTPSTSCQGVTVVPSNSSYEAFLSHLHSFHEHSGRRGPSFEKASRATADMLRTSYWPRQQPHSTQRRALWRPSTCRCASLSLSREPRCMQGRRKRVGNEICTFLRTKVHSTFCNCRNPAVNTKVRMKGQWRRLTQDQEQPGPPMRSCV